MSLSADGITLAIGDREDNVNGSRRGSVRIYDLLDDQFVFTQTLRYNTGSFAVDGALFGNKVALSGGGDTLVIGGNTTVQSVVVFHKSSGVWAHQQTITFPYAVDGGASSLALSNDGNTLAVGSRGDDFPSADNTQNNGAVRIYQRTGTSWALEQTVVAEDVLRGNGVGESVALSADGNTLIAMNVPTGLMPPHTAVYVFVHADGVWTQQKKIDGGDVGFGGDYIFFIALSADGNTLCYTKAPDEKAHVWRRSGSTWYEEQVFDTRDINHESTYVSPLKLSGDGNFLLIGSGRSLISPAGFATIFKRNSGKWSAESTMFPDPFGVSNPSGYSDGFGSSVCMSVDATQIVIGAHHNDFEGQSGAGCLYSFARI